METSRLDLDPPALWGHLRGKLWHATSLKSAGAIIASGSIRPDMKVDRFKTAFCRVHGGVSLFDFSDTEENIASQSHNWQGWLANRTRVSDRAVIWFRINRAAVAGSIKSVADTLAEWHEGKHYAKKFIPHVEVCHAGPVLLSAVEGVLIVSVVDSSVVEWVPISESMDAEITRIEAAMPELPPPDPLFAALERAIRKATCDPEQ